MSEAHNPETRMYEVLGLLQIEAARLARRRDATVVVADRDAIDRQLIELEQRIGRMQRRLKPVAR